MEFERAGWFKVGEMNFVKHIRNYCLTSLSLEKAECCAGGWPNKAVPIKCVVLGTEFYLAKTEEGGG
jgi:hypothetical protein